MPHLTTDDGVKLFYQEVGIGIPIVFVHEFAGDVRSWEAQLRHFGRRYREDFTIIIPRAARAEFRAAGLDLKALRGKRIRGRGVLFSSGGPAIEIRKPASIEIIQGGRT